MDPQLNSMSRRPSKGLRWIIKTRVCRIPGSSPNLFQSPKERDTPHIGTVHPSCDRHPRFRLACGTSVFQQIYKDRPTEPGQLGLFFYLPNTMSPANWSWVPNSVHLSLLIFLLNIPRILLFMLILIITLQAKYSPLSWISRYRLKYCLRTCFLGFLTVNLILEILSCLQILCQRPLERLELLSDVLQALTAAMLVVRIAWGNPLEIKRIPTEHSEAGRSRGRVRRRGDVDDLPPVFPNGWIPVAQSSDIPEEGVLSVSVLGQKLVVFRGSESGQVFALDAYCPHLGADLGQQGRVEGECIVCPFHGWQFHGEDGSCKHIPYSNSIPSVAKAGTWRCVERNGFVFVWHHAEGEPPSWDIPAIPELESGEWKYRGKTEHTVHCHIQEIPENGADVAHLHQLHSRSVFAGADWMSKVRWWDVVSHEWTPDWRPDESRAHVGRMSLSQRGKLLGIALPLLTIHMEIEQIGPAAVQMHLSSWFGRGVFLQHVIPEGPFTMKVVHLLFTQTSFCQPLASMLLLAEGCMFDRDVAVWNHKRLLRTPVLVKEDRLIARYRRWYSQFYSESSPTLRDIMERSLDW